MAKTSDKKVAKAKVSKSKAFDRLKVMTILGTRPELIKMSQVIAELDRHLEQIQHIFVHSGQNFDYELNQVFFDDLEIRKPDYFLEAAGQTPSQTISQIILKSDELFEKEKPDAVLLYGDTNTCLAVIPAKRRKIPVFHMEAGNRCFDQRVPEELNRKVLDHLSDLNLVLTEHARRYLIAEGIRPETIIKTGSHMPEVIEFIQPKLDRSQILKTLKLEKQKYFVVSTHREENVDDPKNLKELLSTLNKMAETYQVPIIVSTHPRTKKRIDALKPKRTIHKLVRFEKPFGLSDYLKLQMNALCVLSDSGTLTEEASLLKFPAIMIRKTHERPEGSDQGTTIMTGLEETSVLRSIAVLLRQKKTGYQSARIADYQTDAVSKMILRTILSYTGYINRTVWKVNP